MKYHFKASLITKLNLSQIHDFFSFLLSVFFFFFFQFIGVVHSIIISYFIPQFPLNCLHACNIYPEYFFYDHHQSWAKTMWVMTHCVEQKQLHFCVYTYLSYMLTQELNRNNKLSILNYESSRTNKCGW